MPMRHALPHSIVEARATHPTAAPAVAPVDKRLKFTATLWPEENERFERAVAAMQPVGRINGGRYPSRADVLAALLALVDSDDDLLDRVREQVAERGDRSEAARTRRAG